MNNIDIYQSTLLNDVLPFWLNYGPDRQHGGIFTCLDRDGSLLDTDKSIWFQGRSAWMFATVFHKVAPNPEYLELAQSCLKFLQRHGYDSAGKLYFSVTHDGKPLRMRRYVYSESFAAIAHAAVYTATKAPEHHDQAVKLFESYLRYSFTPGLIAAKIDPKTRSMKGIGPLMIAIVTAQELRQNLGNIPIHNRSLTDWIDSWIADIQRDFLKEDHKVLLETVGPNGEILDHFEGRQLNPGHAIECAWFILHEARLRNNAQYLSLGLTILDFMWQRGWDTEFGGLFYYRDLHNKPVSEYWHDMKFWWPHCEAIIATLLAWTMTGNPKYAQWYQQVHDWSFQHFSDRDHGEWYGYLHRDGRLSVPLKGNLWKGPFHLPRMLWYCWQLLENPTIPQKILS